VKRFQWAIALPLLVFGPYAFADSNLTFDITQVTGSIDSGGNGTFTMTGPGTIISGDAFLTCQDPAHGFCDEQGFYPGSPVPDGDSMGVFEGILFLSAPYTRVRLGGHDYDPKTLMEAPNFGQTGFAWDLFAGWYAPEGVVPGSTSTVCNHSQMSNEGRNSDEGWLGPYDARTNFTLQLSAIGVNNPGQFCATFLALGSASDTTYYFAGGTFDFRAPASAPEPGTLALMLAGLAGIAGASRRRRGCRRSST
jgi:hypothetical protein